MNDIVNDKKGHNIVNDIMNKIVNDKRGHNIVNDNFTHKPDGLLVGSTNLWRRSVVQRRTFALGKLSWKFHKVCCNTQKNTRDQEIASFG